MVKFKYHNTHVSKMLLNKTEKAIFEKFSKDYSCQIYGRDIAKKFGLNQKTVSNTLNNLEKKDILKFKTEGKNKYYFLNKNNPHIREFITIIELFKKVSFIDKQKHLKKLFEYLDNRTNGILVVFGSYAKEKEKEKSDLDLFVLGKIENIRDLEESFNVELNIVKSEKKKFNLKEPFIREIMENHIILKGAEDFVNLAWSQ